MTSDGGAPADSPWRAVLRSGGARIGVLAISLTLGLVITRWIITHYGADTYAQYGLLVGIAALLPFSDLGIGATVMNAVGESKDPREDSHVRAVLLTSLRGLVASGLVIGGISLVITVAGWWPIVFGAGLDEQYGNLAAGLCLLVFALTIPIAIGQRILSGMGRNHLVVALSGLQSPILLAVLLLVAGWGAWTGSFIPVVSYLALFLIAGISLWFAYRLIGPVLLPAVRDIPRLRSVRGAKAAHTAVPMLVMTIALPLSLQTDRIVLSHVASSASLADYNMAAQLFTPLRLVISAAGMALWAHFAQARTKDPKASPFPLSLAFGGVAVALTLAVSILSPWIIAFASNGEIEVDATTLLSFSLLTIGLALTYPIGMYLSYPAGLKLQAVGTAVLVPINLGLSIVLAERWGTPGPVIASVITTFVLLAVQAWAARTRVRSHREATVTPAVADN